MPLSGSLRQSSSHRAVVARQQSAQIYRYKIVAPIEWRESKLGHGYLRDLFALPPGSFVREEFIADYGRLFGVIVDIPRSAKLPPMPPEFSVERAAVDRPYVPSRGVHYARPQA